MSATTEKPIGKTQVDTARLRAVLEARITDKALSWRQAAGQIGVSPSLLSRLKSGLRPDLDGYVRIVRWLGLSADDFITGNDREAVRDVGVMTEVTALLGRQTDLSEADKVYLQDLIRASLTHCYSRSGSPERAVRSGSEA
jgi:transcriptional regulator with XRE-family HTH domain